MVALQGLVSHHSNLCDAGLEHKRVDVARRLDERISHLYGLCSTSKILQQTEQQPASGGRRHRISNTSSLTATTRAPTMQTPHSARLLEQIGNQSNYSTCGASHDTLRLCGLPLWDPPSTQSGREVLRPCGSNSWLDTWRTEVDGDVLFSSRSIPVSNTLRQHAQPHGADGNPDVLARKVETIHQMERSAVGGAHRRELDFHIRKIHEIEQHGSSLTETSTIDSSQAHDAHSIQFESHDCVPVPALNLDSSRSMKLNHSMLSSQSPYNVQKEGTQARGVDITQLMHQCNLTGHNLANESNLTYDRSLREDLEAERLEVEALRSEVLATRQDLDNERERASLREQEFTHEVGVLRMERVLMQTNCANCKNCQLKIMDLEATLADATREPGMDMHDCAELANLRLQLAHEVEQRNLQERACAAANAEKEEYVLKFEKLNEEHQKQQVSLTQLKKINDGLELQRESNAELDKQRQDMCDRQSALLRKLDAELEKAKRDLVIEREYAVRLLLQIQQLQLEVKREKDHSSSQEIQLRDAFEEIKQQKDSSSTTRFPFPRSEIYQKTGSVFRKIEASLDQADLNVSQRKSALQQVTWESDGLRTQQDDKRKLVSDLQWKIDPQAQKQIKDEHAYLKQVEVVLEEAVGDIERKKLQAAENLTGASHLHSDHSMYSEVKVVVDQMQETTMIHEVSPPGQSVQERGTDFRDWLTSREAVPSTPPLRHCGLIPPKSNFW